MAGTVQYHAATQNTHLMKWSLAALTGRRPVWAVAGRDRARHATAWPLLAKKAKALGEANKAAARSTRRSTPRRALEEPIGEGLSAPISPGKAMAQTFLREPIRIVYLARMLLGLLARIR